MHILKVRATALGPHCILPIAVAVYLGPCALFSMPNFTLNPVQGPAHGRRDRYNQGRRRTWLR
jgi:hypothetical protein